MPHSTLGQSPREVYLAGLTVTGLRPNRRVADDETFRILLLPTTQRGKAKVMPGHGIKVNYLYYWCDAFRQLAVEGTVVSVRYDPFNAGIAYAYVNGLWERCISERYATFQGRSERELAIATAALRQQKRLHRQSLDINAKTLAAFLLSVEGQEAVLEQQRKDSETREVRAAIFREPPFVSREAMQPSAKVQTQTAEARRAKQKVNPDGLEDYGELIL